MRLGEDGGPRGVLAHGCDHVHAQHGRACMCVMFQLSQKKAKIVLDQMFLTWKGHHMYKRNIFKRLVL